MTITFSSPSPPRRWYAALIGTYLTAVAGLALLVRRRDSTPTVEARDVIVLAAATNKLARLGTQEKVTEPLRAPFTEPVEQPDGTRHEQPQRRGARRAGELVTCPFCLSVWIATALTGALLLAPRPTRVTLSAFAAMTGSDLLQRCWARLEPS
ncbi:MAG TPA: DUF1360 domain-containing protein [Acidimicrobiales bacterium]